MLIVHSDFVKGGAVPEGGWGGGTARRPARALTLAGGHSDNVLGTTYVCGLLDGLFQTILQFCGNQHQLHTDVAGLVKTRRKRRVCALERTQEGRWGFGAGKSGGDDEGRELLRRYDDEGGATTKVVEQYRASTAGIEQEYKKKFGNFLETLRVHENYSENFRFLTFRLDFNRFYGATGASPEAVRLRMAQETCGCG